MNFGIVVTTIFGGEFLDAYFEHFAAAGALDEAAFYVVGDRSSPPACRERVERYRSQGLRHWHYLGVEEQEAFLAPFPDLAARIPWKSDNRRNTGFLMAYRDACEVIIAIDDDNYPRPEWPFLEGHRVVGTEIAAPLAVGRHGWFNACQSMMNIAGLGSGDGVFPRGFPYARRALECGTVSPEKGAGRVAANAGLWSGDPDVDAATRLVTQCEAREDFVESVLLAPGVLAPVNTQNTALLREAIPSYYYVRMGHEIAGMKLDRFGDIFSGLFLQKCAQAVGDRIRIGSPVVDHRRSPHNLYRDLWQELAGMVILDDLLELLEAPLPSAGGYAEAYLELAGKLEEWAGRRQGFLWDQALREYFGEVSQNMRLWVEACRELG